MLLFYCHLDEYEEILLRQFFAEAAEVQWLP